MTTTKTPPKPDYDLLAVKYLGWQDAGRSLRDLAYTVAEYRRHEPAPGRRSARKADLNAVAAAARRLQSALGKIDLRTQVTALEAGIAKRSGQEVAVVVAEAAPITAETIGTDRGSSPLPLIRREVSPQSFVSDLADLLRLQNVLAAIDAGFGALADGEAVEATGGRPARHDALLMGLEGLLGLWERHRSDRPTQSEGERGFGAFAQDVFAAEPVGFPPGTVRGAVVDFLPRPDGDESA